MMLGGLPLPELLDKVDVTLGFKNEAIRESKLNNLQVGSITVAHTETCSKIYNKRSDVRMKKEKVLTEAKHRVD